MKKFYIPFLIMCFIFFNVNGIQAQTSQLRQVELMQQFLGTWKCEMGKDTFFIAENKPFGDGMVSNCRIVSKGQAFDSIVQIHGYDKKTDRFIVAELVKSTSVVEVINAWFNTDTSGELVVTNTGNAKFEWKFKFKNPDMLVQTALLNGEVYKEVILRRVKDNTD